MGPKAKDKAPPKEAESEAAGIAVNVDYMFIINLTVNKDMKVPAKMTVKIVSEWNPQIVTPVSVIFFYTTHVVYYDFDLCFMYLALYINW